MHTIRYVDDDFVCNSTSPLTSSSSSHSTDDNDADLLMPYTKKAASTTTPAPVPVRPFHQPLATCHHPLLDARYDLGAKLGRGCFATVYKATRRHDGQQVAIKVIDKEQLDEETEILLNNELQILTAVSQHPGIVTLIDHIETAKHMYFVMDYVEGGPLLDRIVSRGSFSENDARVLLRTILLTLQFLDDLGCVHRDIKPENILVDNHSSTWPVKLTDFGLSAKMQQDQLLYDALGTPLFVAPEILNGQGYDSSCDMWSLGVVMYIVLCGYPPFPFYESPQNLIDAITNGRYDFPPGEWDHVSSDAKNIIRQMLNVDPSKRITPSQALNHRWVSNSQSTCDLPNRKLQAFNGKRKLKASVVAVRTMNIVSRFGQAPSRGDDNNDQDQQCSHEQLLRDVERARAMIERMGIGMDGKFTSMHDRDGQSFDGEMLMSRSNRRSLVLPVNTNEDSVGVGVGVPLGHVPYPEQNMPCLESRRSVWKGHALGSHVLQLDTLTSQYMESRAKAMVAEVNQSGLLSNELNPFMVSAKNACRQQHQQQQHQTSDRSSSVAQACKKPDSSLGATQPVALTPLDFGMLGL